MLVISRRKAQRIDIGQGIVVTILGVRGDRVRIGIDAPSTVSVDRGEIQRRKNSKDGQELRDREPLSKSAYERAR